MPVFQEFKEILVSLIEILKSREADDFDWRKLASATLIVCCLERILKNNPLRLDAATDLLGLFKLTVDVKLQKCPEIEFLLNLPTVLRYM